MPGRSVWLRILGVVDSVLESLVEEPDGSVVAHVRPKRRQRQRCVICGRRSPLYDQGEGRASLVAWPRSGLHPLLCGSGGTTRQLPRARGGRRPSALGAPW